MSRLIICCAVITLFVGCYPQPKLDPVKTSIEETQQMQNATFEDGTPVKDGRRGKRKRREQEKAE